MYRCVSVLSLMFCVIAGVARHAAAQGDPPAVRSTAVTSIATPISIDGVLSEGAWSSAPKIGDLIQRQPDTGQPPTERTDITLLRDADNLYIGVHAYDAEPDRVVGTQMIRDASLNADDRIEIVLDTFRDQRSAFYFATNPAGALVDGLAFANGQLNTEWDAIWHVRTTRTSTGWTAEFAIPFKSLSFPADANVWGFNIARIISRRLEDDRWSGARLDTQFLQISEAGEITNLSGLTQGIGLDLRPFLAGRWLHLGGTGRDEFTRKPGLDVFYSVTPSLRLTATFNTDFGETEVDARQINLTRFSLLFPEKRAFFLEGAGVFSFASTGPETPGGIPGTGADLYPFFSRQIGLLGGREIPLDAGLKLTGAIGRTEVGVLSVRTRQLRVADAQLADDEGFFIGRVKRNLFEQSYVGAIFTQGNPARGLSAQTYGVDTRLATSKFLGRQRNFVVDGFAVRGVNSPAGAASNDDWSYGFSAAYPNDKFDAQIAVREIQRNFRPALGFVQRDNVRLLRIGASYNPRPKFLNIQQIFHDFYYTQFTNLDNNLVESRDAYISLFDWHLRSGDSVHAIMDVNPVYERLFEPFEISPGVFLPIGEYRFTRFRSNAMTAARRRLSVSASVGSGSYWSGKAEQVTASMSFKLPPRFIASVSTNQTFARLPQGNFITRIFTSNIGYTASPRLSFSNLIQYDNRSRNLGWQSRVRWTLQPGNDFFLSFNQGWIQDELENRRMQFRVQDSRVSMKFQYSYRF
ncbi:MAG TPA: DUF5916 domain-containing protein [Vicinamibacterales bacterium]|nr:DUF5916 domain-containing protein [Vicinamibacterales bacterium]